LDPKGAKEMMDLFIQQNKKYGKTIIIISHQLDDVLKYGDEVLLLAKGRLVARGKPTEILSNKQLLNDNYLEPPSLMKLALAIQEKGHKIDLDKIRDIEDLLEQIK